METKQKEWLPHLEGTIPTEVKGFKVSSYAVALEGWRRGLTLKFINDRGNVSRIRYSLTHKEREHLFAGARGDLVTKKAIKICINKALTKEYLMKAGVPTPEGNVFGKNAHDKEIIEYANSLKYPLVLKPVAGSGGDGVIANIKNEKEFRDALSYVRHDLKYQNVIVERFFRGEDYRIYVIGGKVAGAFGRVPANVIGDGASSIKQLLKQKIKERDKNPALYKRPIKIDKEMHNLLRTKGYTLDSVPKKGERVFLKTKNNVSSGGDSNDVTDELSDEIKEIAVSAAKSIPGLVQCGIDIIVDKQKNTGVVLEVNSRPSIRNHLFPNEGKARDIPKAIIDYYFPETKQNHDLSKPQYYFDIKSIFETFRSGIAEEFTVPDVPKGDLAQTRFIVKGTIHGVNYDRWVRRQARGLQLNGYIKYLDKETASIVVSGPAKSINKFRNIINNQSPERARVEKVVEKDRKSPVKVGFEIISSEVDKELKDYYHFDRLKGIPQKGKGDEEYLLQLRKERDFYKKRYKAIKDSRSWKITKPFRMIGNLTKRAIKDE